MPATHEQPMPAMKVAAAAKQLDVSPKTIYRLIASGKLGCIRIGRAVRITHDQLAAYVAATEA